MNVFPRATTLLHSERRRTPASGDPRVSVLTMEPHASRPVFVKLARCLARIFLSIFIKLHSRINSS